MENLKIQYRFQMEGGQQESFNLDLDPVTLECRCRAKGKTPDWVRLEFHQCSNCPLSAQTDPQCPAAEKMVCIVERFSDLLSHDQAVVVVSTEERTISSNTSVQRGVCSVMGLIMATSGCPMTSYFKPMARFHLPFASTAETIWRATSTYLLAQYFKLRNGENPDILFSGLTEFYTNIQIVNLAFAKRLRAACSQDSMVNAVALLDMFAKSTPLAIDESLEDIRHLFVPYLSRESVLSQKD